MAVDERFARIEVTSVEDLRAWLEENHDRAHSVWLVTYKKHVTSKHVPYDALVEEALCFGWVDSQPRALDADRSMRLLSPRRRGSGWSAVNKRRIARLAEAGRLHPAGLAKIEAAKADGSWNRLDAVESLSVPSDLADALLSHPPASDNFSAFPPSSRRSILEWIAQAKKPETRAKRIGETARLAARNRRANHPVGRGG